MLLVMLWPMAHRQLVTRFDINPWKLYGFAMYCTPHQLSVGLYALSGDRRERIVVSSAMPQELLDELDEFYRLRKTLGRLHEPDDLGQAILDALPAVETLMIQIVVIRLPWYATRQEQSERRYVYGRS